MKCMQLFDWLTEMSFTQEWVISLSCVAYVWDWHGNSIFFSNNTGVKLFTSVCY